MTSIFFSDLSTVDSETGLSMQSLLDSQTSSDHLGNGSDSVTDPCHANNIADLALDDCDVFQCGKCQKLFTSFAQFINHKKLHGPAAIGGSSKNGLAEPVVLSDTDILSFSIDQNDLNSHVLTAVPAHSLFVGSDSAITNLQLNPQDNTLTENIFATQMDNDKGEALFNEPSTANQIFVTTQSSDYLSSPPLLSTIQTSGTGGETMSVSFVEVIQDNNASVMSPVSTIELNSNANSSKDARKKQLCPFCCKPFFTKVDLELHAQIHSGDRPYECIICKRMFAQKAHVRKHLKSHRVWPKAINMESPSCAFCLQILAPDEVKSHYMMHTDRKVFECSQKECGWMSEDLNTFLEHITSHNAMISCRVCEQVFTTQEDLNVHQYIEHEQSCENVKDEAVVSIEVIQERENAKTVKSISDTNSVSSESEKRKLHCPYCNKVFYKNFDLEQHIRSHTGERPFQCVVCGRAFTQKSHVKKHMMSHKVWPGHITTLVKKEAFDPLDLNSTTIDRAYACQFCTKVFATFLELKSHRLIHADRKVYKCIQNDCEWASPDLDAFLEHLSVHSNEATYSCHICNKTFSSLDDFGIHQYYHEISPGQTPAKNFWCKKCKRKFTSQEHLKTHLQRDSHRHLCPFCPRVFVAERFLRKHLIIHANDFPFKCKECDKAFKTAQYLAKHESVHSSKKPFSCPQCHLEFKRSDRLKRHLLTHETVKKFKCSFHALLGCEKEFSRKDKLKDHILTHYKSDRTVCDICDKDFKRFSVLMKHRQTCANEENEASSDLKTETKRVTSKLRNTLMNKAKCFIETVPVEGDNVPTIEIVVRPVNKSTNMSRKLATLKLSSFKKTQSSNIFTPDLSQLISLNESVDNMSS